MVRVKGKTPKFRSNGFAVYSGQDDLRVDGLDAVLPNDGRPIRQGHVCIQYDDGHFLTYTSTIRGNGVYSFS